MLKPGDIAIVSGARTPMGPLLRQIERLYRAGTGGVRGQEAIERSGVDPKEFDHVVFGNAQQTSGDAFYGARHVALRAGLPIETPALTVNRLCGSGMQSIVNAAQMIQTRRSENRAGRRHGSHVAGAVRDPRARWLHAGARRQAGRFADGRPARHLLRPLHGEHRRALRRAAGHHATDAGRVRAAVAADGRCGLQSRAPAGRDRFRSR